MQLCIAKDSYILGKKCTKCRAIAKTFGSNIIACSTSSQGNRAPVASCYFTHIRTNVRELSVNPYFDIHNYSRHSDKTLILSLPT